MLGVPEVLVAVPICRIRPSPSRREIGRSRRTWRTTRPSARPDFWERARDGSRRPARRQGPQHRPRGGRPPCARRSGATTLRSGGSARTGAVRDFTYADLRTLTNRFANVLAGARRREGRPRLRPRRADPGALRRRARHAQERQRLLAALLGVRARADPDAARDRPGEGARDDRDALRAQGRGAARLAPRPRARDPRRTRRAPSRTWKRRSTTTGSCSRRPTSSRSSRPRRMTSPWSTSRAGRRGSRRARCTCTRPSSPTTPPGSSRSTSIPTTSSGARPTRAG